MRFDRKDPEEHFVELTKLKQSGNPKTYISEFLRLSVMVPDLLEPRRIYMFIDGLAEPLRGLVRSTRPTTLEDAVGRTKDLQDALPRTRAPIPNRLAFQQRGRDTRDPPPGENQGRGPLDDETRRDLRRKKLCFTCQESWAPGHRCARGKEHDIEVFSNNEEEENTFFDMGGDTSIGALGENPPPPPPLAAGGSAFAHTGGVIASLQGVPKYLTC